jgi:hypothetical protein
MLSRRQKKIVSLVVPLSQPQKKKKKALSWYLRVREPARPGSATELLRVSPKFSVNRVPLASID